MALSPQDVPTATAATPPRQVAIWHLGWALGVGLSGLVLTLAERRGARVFGPALVIAVLPALAGAIAFVRRDGRGRRDLLLVAWSLAGLAACVLTGGVSGPLAIWCAAPMAAAVVLGGPRRLAQGAALSLLAATLAALAQAARLVGPTPVGATGASLGLIGIVSLSVGLAAALLSAQRRAGLADEARSEADAGLLRALNRQPNLTVILDDDGRIERLFGGSGPLRLAAERLSGGLLLDLADGPERVALDAARAAAGARGQAALRFTLAGGEPVRLAIEIRRLDPARLVASLRDAGPEHDREAALDAARAEAEALNLGKSRFLAGMSHELRTPLNAIMGFSDVMRQRIFGDLTPRYAEYADLIHDAGGHLLDLINDVLDMSKIEAARYELSREALDAREPIQAAMRLMRLQADEAGVHLRGVLPGEPLVMEADRRALKQIVLNLVSNALKFTPKGGQVTVSLQALAGAAVELSVSDTGVGIASEDLERLGRPFEQAGDLTQQQQGTGLGLSLVRAFAELHGGSMMIESRLGEGTAVVVRLPDGLAAALATSAETAEADA